MFSAFILSVSAVFLAEMGDKTQLLALAFSTRYRWRIVLAGVAAATAVSHLLAVVAGNLITNLVPIAWVELLAAVSFLLFALWTLHDDTGPDAKSRRSRSPFLAVAIAFFVAEMGDKTQLMTLSLGAGEAAKIGGHGILAKMMQIVPVWCGTTLGMIIADALGILVGVAFHKRIPTHVVKWVAAGMFAAFGMLGIHASLDQVLPKNVTLHHILLLGLIPILAALMVLIARSSSKRAAERLSQHT